jgi:hypothetical protein
LSGVGVKIGRGWGLKSDRFYCWRPERDQFISVDTPNKRANVSGCIKQDAIQTIPGDLAFSVWIDKKR